MRCLIALLAVLVSASAALAADRLKVVASFSILADMTRQIAGARADVSALVGPRADAHVFQPSPAEAKRLAGADLVVINGLGFEGWMDRLAESAGYDGPVVTAAGAVAPLRAGARDHDHDHNGHGALDPHAWQDVANALVYADSIAAGLCEADARGCAHYRAGAAAYKDKLAALDAEIGRAFEAIAPARRRVITSHDAFGYFARAYGIAMLSPVAASTDTEPSAADIARLIRQIEHEGVTAIFVETIADRRLLERIAEDTGAAIGGDVYSDSLSPANGPAATYIDMMRHNARTIAGALAGS